MRSGQIELKLRGEWNVKGGIFSFCSGIYRQYKYKKAMVDADIMAVAL